MPTGFPCRHSMFFVSIENSPINSEHLRWCLMRKFTTNPFMVQGGIFGTLPSCNGQQIHLLANQLLSANCSFLRRTTFVATHFCIWLPVRGLCMRWSLNHEGTQRRLASVGDTDSVSPLFFLKARTWTHQSPPGSLSNIISISVRLTFPKSGMYMLIARYMPGYALNILLNVLMLIIAVEALRLMIYRQIFSRRKPQETVQQIADKR